ncbi:hypothetical protein KAR48_02830 [bacterium]|nr:hypothetical protein [bacterium]
MIQIQYKRSSPAKEQRRDRAQLIGTALVLMLTLMGVLEDPTTPLIILAIISVLIGCVHLFCGIRYNHLKNLMDNHFDIALFRITGIVFLLDGAMLQLQGSHTVFIIHYALGLFYFFGLISLRKKVEENFILKADESALTVNTFKKRPETIPWSEISSIQIESHMITVIHTGRRRPRRFYIDENADSFIKELTLLARSYSNKILVSSA